MGYMIADDIDKVIFDGLFAKKFWKEQFENIAYLNHRHIIKRTI